MPKAEQVSEGKRHTKTQGEVLQIKTLPLGSKTLEPVRDSASKGQNQFVIYASFRETLVPTPKPTKAQQDTQKRQSFPDETHVRLKGRCVCATRGSHREEKPGRTDRDRRTPQESGETNESPRKRRTATHTNTFRKFLQKRLLREAVGFLELLLEERIP